MVSRFFCTRALAKIFAKYFFEKLLSARNLSIPQNFFHETTMGPKEFRIRISEIVNENIVKPILSLGLRILVYVGGPYMV